MLECRNLGYRYGKEDAWVFRNLNLKVHPGESLAIIGPSGCGKSTLLGLLMGLIQPEEGQIFWKGMELKAANRDAYRARIAGVLQDDILFSGSIAENISGFDDEMDMEWVADCARNAQIYEDIQRMPMTFETIVGEMGSTLSGGQRQRLILARALYQAPRILFLDEATSNLDPASEQAVEAVLNELPITRVIVTHRPGTAERADRIFAMGLPQEIVDTLAKETSAIVTGLPSPSPD
nr:MULTISPECIES: ATP-binding cassette domain-containing protein [Acetobacteraceae]